MWPFNGQNCGFYNLNWINVLLSQKRACFSLYRMSFTPGNDRPFQSVKSILNKKDILYVRHV
jgi:hypothetical protein